MPIRFCPAVDLEGLVSLTSTTAGRFLMEYVQSEKHMNSDIGVALTDGSYQVGRNAVIEQAWKSLPWEALERGGEATEM